MNMHLISKRDGLNCVGKDPKGIAAAAVYLAAQISNYGRTQVEVAQIASVTEVTIRSRVKQFKKYI